MSASPPREEPLSVSRRALELQAILGKLAEQTTFPPARERALALEPSPLLEHAVRLQAQTSQARAYLQGDPHPDLSSASDVREAARRAAKGAILGTEELLAVAATLRVSGSHREALLASGEEWPLLAEIAGRLGEDGQLLQDVERSLGPEGEVLDSASPELARVRAQQRALQERIQARLEQLLASPQTAPLFQERLVTQRAGRYVLPLRAEARGRIPGIVHDESASGQTLYIEPLATVELNNDLRRLEKEEERQVQLVLERLSSRVGELQPVLEETVEGLSELDLVLARGKYARQVGGHEPELVEAGRGAPLELHQARHPLLEPQTVVPIDVQLGGEVRALLISGPNTGGKTVTLKTVGLCALMAQLGMHLPAGPGSRVPLYDAVLADIGDEQSIQQSLSTFSSHMGHIVAFLRRASERSLLLLDELGAGTDPVEGSGLARALLLHLLERGCTVLATTHHSELKIFAHETPGVENASVEFDPQTLAPTYRLLVGLPGRSNALAIARRLGLDEAILEQAARWVPAAEQEMDRLLGDIRQARTQAVEERLGAEADRRQAEALRQEVQAELERLRSERERLLDRARAEVKAELARLWEELRQVRRRLAEVSQESELEEPGGRLSALEEELAPPAEPAPEELHPGDRVWHRGLSQLAEVVEVRAGQVELQVGSFRLSARPEELSAEPGAVRPEELSASAAKGARRPAGEPEPYPATPVREVPLELHLRGQRVEEALQTLDRYLSDAALSGLPEVRVVHGKGTGALRRAVREFLGVHPLVRGLRQAEEQEGGSGVTVVQL